MLNARLSEIARKCKPELPELAFCLFSTRLVLLGASIGDSIAIVSLAAILAYKWFLSKNTEVITESVTKDIADLKNHMQALKIDRVYTKKPVNEPQNKRYF